MKKHLPLIGILAVSLALRLLYMGSTTSLLITPDSHAYYDFGTKLYLQHFWVNFFNDYRLPLYPLLVGTIMKLTGSLGAEVFSASFSQSLLIIVGIQTVFGLMGIILVHALGKTLSLPTRINDLLALFIGCNLLLFTYERAILTESLTVFWIIWYLFIVYRTMRSPTWRNFALLVILSILGFILRPTYVLLPLCILPIIPLIRRSKGVTTITIVALLAYLAFPILYVYKNQAFHGYTGITHIMDINVMGRILHANIPVDAGKQYRYFYTTTLDYRQKGGDMGSPYQYLSDYDYTIYGNPPKLAEFQAYTRSVMMGAFGAYAGSAVSDIPQSLIAAPADDILLLDLIDSPVIRTFFTSLFTIYKGLLYLNFGVFLFLPYVIFTVIKRRSVNYGLLAAMGILSLYHIVVTTLFGYGEWGRLIIVGVPIYLLFTLFCAKHVYATIINRSMSNS